MIRKNIDTLVITLLLVVTGTLAYFSANEFAENKELPEKHVQNLINYYESIESEKITVDGKTYIIQDCNGVPDSIEDEEKLYEVVNEVELEYLGEFKLTGYCPCEKCCGKWADGYTATMTKATEGRTIAVDPNIIPLGSHVIINGQEYIAEDTGSAINQNRIDIYKDSHSSCFSSDCNGYADVYLIKR